RNEAGDIADGGLHEGVAEGGLVARRGLVGRHCHMMPAAADAEEHGQGEERDPGAAGREKTPATHVTSSPGQAGRERQGRGGEGAAGAAAGGAGAAGDEAAGAVGGMMVSARRGESTASENDVTRKTTAAALGIFPSTGGVPMEPKTAWLPAPPKAQPLSAAFPDCSSTSPMMIRLTRTWMRTIRMNMRGLLL